MFSTEDGDPLAIVKGGSSNGEIIFTKDIEKKNTVVRTAPVRNVSVLDGELEQLPCEKIRVIYIAGPSGSGKSTWASRYIEKFRNIYPDAPFYIISYLKSDTALDYLDPQRIEITEDMIDNPLQLEECPPGSIILFDDCDNISNPKLQKSVNKFKEQILEMGRHTDIKCIVTSHLINPNDRQAARTILNEMQCLVIFPKSGSSYQIKYVLKQYYGLSSKQINALLSVDSRWLSLIKTYPQVMLSEHKATFINTL